MKLNDNIGKEFKCQIVEICAVQMKQMQLGLSTYTFPWNVMLAGSLPSHSFSFREMLQFTSDSHIHFFQFGDNYPLHLLSKNELKEIKELALEKNIQLQVGTRGLHINHIKNYLLIASELNSAFLRVVIDDENYRPAEKDVIQIIHVLLPSLKESGIALAIENHDRFKVETFVQIIKQTDPEFVGICLDTANSLGAGEGITEILPALLPFTINLHIKDFTIARAHHKMGFIVSGTPAGSGMLDIPWLLNECSRYERCSTATLELWMNEENSAEQTLAKEISLVTESIKYLKEYIS